MYNNIMFWYKRCLACLQNNKGPKVSRKLLPIVATERFEVLAMDHLSGLGVTANGNKAILVVSDYVSKFVFAFAVPNLEALTVANILVKNIFTVFGCCRMLLSDQGAAFAAKVSEYIFQVMNIKKLRTAAYHPQTDGLVEKFNGTVVNMLRKYVNAHLTNWDELLPFVVAAYNWSEHSSTKTSPFFLTFGRDPLTSLDAMLLNHRSATTQKAASKAEKEMRDFLDKSLPLAVGHSESYREKWSRRLNEGKPDLQIVYQPGDVVLVKRNSHGTAAKLKKRWGSPMLVAETIESNVRLTNLDGTVPSVSEWVSVDRLKPCPDDWEDYFFEDDADHADRILDDELAFAESTFVSESDSSDFDVSPVPALDLDRDGDVTEIDQESSIDSDKDDEWSSDSDESEYEDVVDIHGMNGRKGKELVGLPFKCYWKSDYGVGRYLYGRISRFSRKRNEYLFKYDNSRELWGPIPDKRLTTLSIVTEEEYKAHQSVVEITQVLLSGPGWDVDMLGFGLQIEPILQYFDCISHSPSQVEEIQTEL
eukprot:TRINITY_DN325_c0_g1_i2.p1 TRINITY_DN325_c0_g1~~TRINITY_DN325_c0_g1_i2.p1  ORF type:complete len:534 (-),score=75.65 TRINITY_DN325_c0_g1_i2:70-1671(-)